MNVPLAFCHRSTLRGFGLRRNFRRSCFRRRFQLVPDRGFLPLLRVGFARLAEKQIDQTGMAADGQIAVAVSTPCVRIGGDGHGVGPSPVVGRIEMCIRDRCGIARTVVIPKLF